jgi:hypothetical protein
MVINGGCITLAPDPLRTLWAASTDSGSICLRLSSTPSPTGMVATPATAPMAPTAATPTPPASVAAPSTTCCQRHLGSLLHPACLGVVGEAPLGPMALAARALGWVLAL